MRKTKAKKSPADYVPAKVGEIVLLRLRNDDGPYWVPGIVARESDRDRPYIFVIDPVHHALGFIESGGHELPFGIQPPKPWRRP